MTTEMVTKQQCLQVATLDGKASLDVKGYVDKNKEIYYVAINVWLLMSRELSDIGSVELMDHILREGLFATIKSCDEVASSFVRGELRTDPWNERLVHDILKNEKYSVEDRGRLVLQLMRFLKRFSPQKTDWLVDSSLKDFLNTHKALTERSFKPYPELVISYLKKYFEIIEDVLVEHIQYERVYEDGTSGNRGFSSGNCSDAKSQIGRKISKLSEYLPNLYDDVLYPISAIGEWDRKPHCTVIYPQDENLTLKQLWAGYRPRFFDPVWTVTPQAVPKSFDKRRIIGPESTVRAYLLQEKRALLEKTINSVFSDSVHIHDQSYNQELARIGSVSGDYATLDLSHASDLISLELISRITSPWLFTWLTELNATHLNIGGRVIPSWMFATAGNPITFAFESLLFAAIVYTSIDIYCLFAKKRTTTCMRLKRMVSVYGDDLIVPSEVAQTTIDVLESLGFEVNASKSFTSGPYRESCGEEFLNGFRMTHWYWPRATIDAQGRDRVPSPLEKPLYVSFLCELQHRVFPVSWYAQRFIRDIVLSLYPQMTSSAPYSPYSDLWENAPRPKMLKPPTKAGAEVPEAALREYHCSLGEKGIHGQIPKGVVQAIEMYRYTSFLKDGPLFKSAIDELLGVSDPLPSAEELYFGAESKISLTLA